MPLNPQLLEILRCPACLSTLVELEQTLICTGAECRRRYAIRDEIPNMLIEESETLTAAEWRERLQNRKPAS